MSLLRVLFQVWKDVLVQEMIFRLQVLFSIDNW